MTTIFIDIQTIPTQDETQIAAITRTIKPPAHYRQPETIAKWYQENLRSETERRYQQTALDGLYGEIFSIAWAIDEGDITVFWRDELSSEAGLLKHFMAELADLEDQQGKRRYIHKWVGHYISGFDLRFIWQRCVINQIKPSVAIPLDAKAWDERVFDTQQMWCGTQLNQRQSSLAALSTAFGLKHPLTVDSSEVYQDWLAGRYQEIAEYNRMTVQHARQLYRRMNFMEPLNK